MQSITLKLTRAGMHDQRKLPALVASYFAASFKDFLKFYSRITSASAPAAQQ
jgi:hypothetical protein